VAYNSLCLYLQGKRVRNKKTAVLANVIVVSFLFAWMAAGTKAQTIPPLEKIKSQEELDKAVTALDAALFDSYNKCDLEKFKSFFADDVELYHDQGGRYPRQRKAHGKH
jgi:hypothetical protein